jgi:putative flippase GtrA
VWNISISFVTNKVLVFRSKGNWLEEYVKGYVVYGGTAVISGLLLWVLLDFIGLSIWISQAISMVCATLFTYFGHDKFTFKKHVGDKS